MCMCWRSNLAPPLDELPRDMEFKFVPEPYASEIHLYVRQRREHILLYATLADVRAELLRRVPVTPNELQPVDLYPRGRAMLNDDDYLSILKDMFNLSNVLDDMELTGAPPYHAKGHFYNVYSRLYRMLVARAKQAAPPG
ncbi:hypothetical protein Rsub_09204 [Raphidocelis subcapitata]|uniref:Uncharacterized protein n=1 Tax=Raphidocelis subcapitata TaxID=307507 RepID=A0A2V0PH92_9CHLO|nr:hypothetical protein Rsub_09204 [Raphidocelis subcapitata]|eukprot:GBF96405.1 hypothetical protein Rsub_09204 [Raphidocelis subcapitata]